MPPIEQMHPLWEADNLRRALQAAGVALWSWNVDTDRFTMDDEAKHVMLVEPGIIA